MDRIRSLMTLFVVFLVAGLLALGCSSGTEEPEAPTPEAAVETTPADDSAAATPQAETGKHPSGFDASRFPTDLPEGITAEIPYNFPKDIPIYPGSAPAQGKGAEVEGVPMSALQLVTGDPPTDAFEFYRNKLESEGWTIERAEDLGRNAAISASQGERRTSILIAPSSDGGSDIFVVSEG
jgi:hypothetical protein